MHLLFGVVSEALAVLTMVTAIITLSNIHGIGDTDTAFVAVYSLIFALLLSIYEFSHCGCCYEEVEERCGGFYRKVRKMRSEPHIFCCLI